MEDFKTKDYSYLEGAPVTVYYTSGDFFTCGVEINGVVAGIEYDIGITIETADGSNLISHEGISAGKYISCVPGPSSPEWHGFWEPHYDSLFQKMVSSIEEGGVWVDELVSLMVSNQPSYRTTGGAVSECSFSQ